LQFRKRYPGWPCISGIDSLPDFCRYFVIYQGDAISFEKGTPILPGDLIFIGKILVSDVFNSSATVEAFEWLTTRGVALHARRRLNLVLFHSFWRKHRL